jgi:hypothetical protein
MAAPGAIGTLASAPAIAALSRTKSFADASKPVQLRTPRAQPRPSRFRPFPRSPSKGRLCHLLSAEPPEGKATADRSFYPLQPASDSGRSHKKRVIK